MSRVLGAFILFALCGLNLADDESIGLPQTEFKPIRELGKCKVKVKWLCWKILKHHEVFYNIFIIMDQRCYVHMLYYFLFSSSNLVDSLSIRFCMNPTF